MEVAIVGTWDGITYYQTEDGEQFTNEAEANAWTGRPEPIEPTADDWEWDFNNKASRHHY